MFRNVTGAQEAVVHRQSEDSLSHENNQIKLIKDVQSDDIAQTYSTLKDKWIRQREQLIENLKNLEKNNAFPHEIQHAKNLIECFNELIDNGEVTKNCQILITDINQNIQPLPETYMLPKQPLGEKMIRLPRHTSKTTSHISNSLKNISSDIIHAQHQVDPQEQKHIDETSDHDKATTSGAPTEEMKTGIQFYVVAEHFRNQTDTKKPGKKHYFSSSVME